MDFKRSSNPVMSDNVFQRAANDFAGTGEMTVKGTASKSLLLLLLIILTGSITYKMTLVGNASASALMIGGCIGGFILALVNTFRPDKSFIFAPLYALCEGLALGGLSAFYAVRFDGIILNAVLLTSGIALAMFFCYRTGLLRATPAFVKGIVFATSGIAIFYLVSLVASFFEVNISVFSMGKIGLIIQLVIVVIAAFNLIMDFSFIEENADNGAPAYMEWYGAFSLMVTLVWLYVELLRLLAIFARRD